MKIKIAVLDLGQKQEMKSTFKNIANSMYLLHVLIFYISGQIKIENLRLTIILML